MRHLVLMLLSIFAIGVTADGAVIPSDRVISWQGNVGVAGGIPQRTTVFQVLPAGSSLATVQNALRACPPDQVVELAAGSYAWNGTLDWQGVNDGVVLRGAGSARTVVTITDGFIYMRNYFSEAALSREVALSADAVKGSSVLTVSSVPSWVVVGDTILIDQLDDPSFVAGVGTSGGSGYRELTGNGTRGLAQMNRVVAKTATTITVELPLFYGWKTARAAQVVQPGHDTTTNRGRYRCGIEGMKLVSPSTWGGMHMIKMENCDSCWIKDVVSEDVPGDAHVWTAFCYRCEVRDSTFRGAHLYGGGQAYGVALYHVSTGFLIENNIFGGLHNAMTANYGSSGNVFAYNYEYDGKSDARQNAGNNTHGVHCYMNLWEGNYCEDKVLADWTHGSASHNTVFRSRITGENGTSSDERTCVSIEYYNRYWNIVGNVLGTAGLQNKYLSHAGSPSSGSNGNIFKIGGEVNINDDYSPSDAASFTSGSFILIHGNYDTVTQGVAWEPAVADHQLPASLYLPAKPVWFGDRPWPAFDPANPAAASVTALPAGYRHVNGTNPPAGGGPTAVAPTLTAQPQGVVVTAGQTATFSVAANGTPTPSYQWQKNGSAIAGATAASYTTPATTTADNGAAFRCVVANSAGSVTSNAATLTVNVPTSTTGSGTGLAATYYDNADFTGKMVSRIDPTVNFSWGSGSPATGIGINTFSARWRGQVQAQRSETYTFFVTGDDGIRLWVNGQRLVNQWKDQGAKEYSGTIALTAGQKYDLLLEYYENSGAAVAKLAWSSASTAKQTVPTSQLYPAVGTPSAWTSGDVGGVGLAGSSSLSNGAFTVTGSGADIWFNADAFRFVSQPLSGDGSIVARVTSVQNTDVWAKAGVMIRESTATGARHAFCCVTPGNGVAFQYRAAVDGSSSHVSGSANTSPRWMKLVRQGNMLFAYESADGQAWSQVGKVGIAFGPSVRIGLAVTSHTNATLCTAVFDHVVVTPGGSG